MCTLNFNHCAELVGGLSVNVAFSVFNILQVLASHGTNVFALANSYSSVAAIGATLVNDICAFPNKLQTQCIRKFDNGNFQSCDSNAINKVACGLFCTSTQVVCAKTIIDLTSQIAGVLGLVFFLLN